MRGVGGARPWFFSSFLSFSFFPTNDEKKIFISWGWGKGEGGREGCTILYEMRVYDSCVLMIGWGGGWDG